jgi:hypothetical protein
VTTSLRRDREVEVGAAQQREAVVIDPEAVTAVAEGQPSGFVERRLPVRLQTRGDDPVDDLAGSLEVARADALDAQRRVSVVSAGVVRSAGSFEGSTNR